ncbi:tetraacyldisaccharide 4'-kinase [Pseudoalteromonas denitrificans]|uniref:Tetraacyldisaccharide 4'-kinase n=1 Tax=Pseudoalteromonas denitrificans DSM 6059 TaxID=1123010 RepID=A0A1I1NG02_9GAMM|nr:tetraacyldisaccharide 4'-kinase [Pseudoalteromonas denitrificans]SFC96415.1 lipid-A-disaccharide kinase [Pseudoalteromonas denitrificans DSM 6059]
MSRIETSWYQKYWYFNILTWLLLPFSALFWLLSSFRKLLFKLGIKKSYKAEVPIIVVGNISVGGNGKTPMVIWLCEHFSNLEKKIVVISRGYGGKSNIYPLDVNSYSSPYKCGDEPVLIAKRTGFPVIVGPSRVDNIKLAVQKYNPDIIISDDGMQHYKMARDIELCIVDSKRQFGNGLLMPAGPLRESQRRLESIDLVIENGGDAKYHYLLESVGLFHVHNDKPAKINKLTGIAVSAIGNPARFENSLEQEKIIITDKKHFRDHHKFTLADFDQNEDINVFMTEKDAVKCKSFAKSNWYYLKVNANLNKHTQETLTTLLNKL